MTRLTSRITLPEFGLGAAPLGHLYASVTDDEAKDVVARSLAAGFTHLDVAPAYGLGLAETRLGEALRGVDRSHYTISTKVGQVLVPTAASPGAPAVRARADWSESGIRRSLEESLTRLGLDYVDILFLHDADHAAREVVETSYPTAQKLKEEGLTRAIGFGMNHVEPLTTYVRTLDVDVILVAGRFTLLDQRAGEELLPLCAARGTSVIVGGAFNSGILAAPHDTATFDYRAADHDLIARARSAQRICEAHGTTLPAAAMRFPLLHPAVDSVVIGMRSVAEVEANRRASQVVIPRGLWSELAEAGFVPPLLIPEVTP